MKNIIYILAVIFTIGFSSCSVGVDLNVDISLEQLIECGDSPSNLVTLKLNTTDPSYVIEYIEPIDEYTSLVSEYLDTNPFDLNIVIYFNPVDSIIESYTGGSLSNLNEYGITLARTSTIYDGYELNRILLNNSFEIVDKYHPDLVDFFTLISDGDVDRDVTTSQFVGIYEFNIIDDDLNTVDSFSITYDIPLDSRMKLDTYLVCLGL